MNGPLVEVTGLSGTAIADMVALGEHGLPGEVVAIRGQSATVQAYEYTGGLALGAAVRSLRAPLSAPLGPGLLGGIFDGLLRPLLDAGSWLDPATAKSARDGRRYHFTPHVTEGQRVTAGTPVGTVRLAGGVAYQVLVPPGLDGTAQAVRTAGEYPGDAVVATVAGAKVKLTQSWPVRQPRPYRERLPVGAPLRTGQRVIDLLFPVPRGGAVAVPGGFGTGKTVLLQQIAKWCDADVIVYVGCGERGNEMADVLAELAKLTDPRTGGRLAQRTVVVANTSNMPMMAREASIYSAVTVAEHFRDMGLDAVVIADSTSRWAEAQREFASRTGELPAEEGYPAALASALAAFYERAGRVTTLAGAGEGSVTIIGAISPQGGDLTEPVTTHTQRFVRGMWTLDRDLAYARHYPAVSWAGSFTRDATSIARWHADHRDPGWAARRQQLARLLTEADRLGALADLVGVGALPAQERVVMLAGRLVREGVLQQSALSPRDAACDLDRAAALADMVLDVAERCRRLAGRGVRVAALEQHDFTRVIRAREDADTPDAVRACRDATLTELASLESEP